MRRHTRGDPVELSDDHLLGDGSGDEEMQHELRRALDDPSSAPLSWKFLAPALLVSITLLVALGYILGSTSVVIRHHPMRPASAAPYPPAGIAPGLSMEGDPSTASSMGGLTAFSGGTRVSSLERQLNEERSELEKERTDRRRLEGTVAELETRLNKMATQEAEAEVREAKERQKLSSELESEREELISDRKELKFMEKKYAAVTKAAGDGLGALRVGEKGLTAAEKQLEAEVAELRQELESERRGEEFGSDGGSGGGGGAGSGGGKRPNRPKKKLLDFNMDEMKQAAQDMKSMLEGYWKGSDVLTNTMYLRGGSGADWERRAFDMGEARVADKIARALVWGDRFIVAAMGSSVIAGHDNCNYDSYERQMQRLLAPLWQRAGVEFVVRNAGEGGGCGDSHRNQIWCLRHMLGDDIDVAHYSWTYFESPSEQKYHEAWIRWALMMKRAPVPQFLNTGGETDAACRADLDDSGRLFQLYGKFGVNMLCLQNGITRFAGYAGKKWGAVGDGMHETTRYGESETPARRRSLGVTFRNWHPGPLGFQVVSDAFSYYYVNAMLRAIGEINKVRAENAGRPKALTEALASRWPKRPAPLSAADLPAPEYCMPEVCGGDEPPGCTNFESPTYGRGQIRVLSPKDDMNPYHGEARAGDKGWSRFTREKSDLIPKAEAADPRCAHLDACGGLEGDASSGLLTLRLPRMALGRIIICSPDGKEAGRDLIDRLQVKLEQTPLPRQGFLLAFGKCVQVQERFQNSVHDAKGHLHLGVRVSPGAPVRISHVIAL